MNLRLIAVAFLAVIAPNKLFSASAPGQVLIWGSKGQSSTKHFTERLEIGGNPVTDAVAISAGRDHALILRGDGTVIGWGHNQYGQTNIPLGLTNVVAVAAGAFYSIALDKEGNISAWGTTRISSGNAKDVIAVSASYRTLALKRDGTVFSWSEKTGLVPGITNIIAIAAGGADNPRNLALKSEGIVIAWGDEHVPAGLSNVTAIAVGERHSLALKKDGTVYGWGDNHCEQATGVKNTNGQRNASGHVVHSGQVLSNVVAIAAGNQYGMFGMVTHHSLALKRDGTVVGW